MSVWNRSLIVHDTVQGFVVPRTFLAVAIGLGSIFNYIWISRSLSTSDMYTFPISAGLLAGGGLTCVLDPLPATAGIDGSVYGTLVGFQGFEYRR